VDNVEFTYLYRDGGNYKKWGRVVFSNPDRLDSDSVEKDLRLALLQDGLFIASQIRVPEVFLYAGGEFSFDDHCYHELDGTRQTPEAATDAHGRSISEFLVEANREAAVGWRAFDPYDSEGSISSYLTSLFSPATRPTTLGSDKL
jgi:hypothetical protein